MKYFHSAEDESLPTHSNSTSITTHQGMNKIATYAATAH